MAKKHLLVLICLVWFSKVYSLEYLIKNYTLSEGLRGTTIYSYHQDSMGLLWMGSELGLHSFDGKNFKNYNIHNIKNHGNIIDIIQENKQLILLSSHGKLIKFDGHKFTPFKFNDPELDSVKIIRILKLGKLFFVVSKSNGIFLHSNDSTSVITGSKIEINDATIDRKNNLFILSGSTIFKLKNDSLVFHTKQQNKTINGFLVHDKFYQWASTKNGGIFMSKDKKNWKHIFPDRKIEIYGISEDKDATVWVYSQVGLFRIIDNSFDEIYSFQEIFDEIIFKLYIDSDNNIWASSKGKGVYKLSKNNFSNSKFPSSFDGTSAQILLKDKSRNIWVNAKDYGLIQFSHDCKVSKYQTFKKHGKRNINCAVNYKSMSIFGGNKLLLSYNENHFSGFTSKGLPPEFKIIHLSASNNFLYAINNDTSLYSYNNNLWKKIELNIKQKLTCIECTNDKIWLGTNNGAFLLKEDKNTIESEKLGGHHIYSIIKDYKNNILIGTDKGLYIFHNDSLLYHINDKKGIINNHVQAIGVDSNNIYLGTKNGLSIYNNEGIQNYTSTDGLINNNIIPGRIESSENKIFIAANNGYSILLLRNIVYRDSIHNAFISSIRSLKDTIFFNQLQHQRSKKIIFPSNTKTLAFDLSIVDFSNSTKNLRYKAKRKNKWNYIFSNTILLTELNSGNYTLEVERQDCKGRWGNILSQDFYIEQPIFISRNAIILYILLIIITFAYIIKFRINKKQNKYKTSSLSENKFQIIESMINSLLENDKIYKQPEVSLSVLAQKINASKEHTSQVINTVYKKNFNSLINYYRINEAKRLLLEKDSNKTIIEIGYEVGFNSKTAFNTTFKKETNCTPTQYKNNNRSI